MEDQKEISELLEYGYTLVEAKDNILTFSKAQYMDNGEGYYFTADIEIFYNVLENEITEILIDGVNLAKIQEKTKEIIGECAVIKQYDFCAKDEFGADDVDDEWVEKITEKQNLCGDCTYYSMLESWMAMLQDGSF